MTHGPVAHRLDQATFVSLCLLLLVMPSIEAPKTVALVLFVLFTVARQWVERSADRPRPDLFEWSLLGLVAASAASTLVNWPIANKLKGVTDTAMYAAGCWCVYRGQWSDRKRSIAAAMIAIGVVAGLVRGAVDVYSGQKAYLEFHSAGVVTQSSMYLGIALVMVGGILVSPVGPRRRPWRIDRVVWALAVLIMTVGLAVMASRGAMVAVAVTWVVVLAFVRRLAPVLGTCAAIMAMVLILDAAPDRFNQSRLTAKVTQWLTTFRLDDSDSLRVANWRIATARVAQGDALVFGVGPRNFSGIDVSTLSLDLPVDLTGQKLNHAHNLFLNKLVEEGLVGLIAFLFFLGVVARRLAQDWRRTRRVAWPWIAALGAMLVPSIAGSFNTPWYQEHAWLAMLLIGLYCAPRAVPDEPHTNAADGTVARVGRSASSESNMVTAP